MGGGGGGGSSDAFSMDAELIECMWSQEDREEGEAKFEMIYIYFGDLVRVTRGISLLLPSPVDMFVKKKC